MLVAVIVLSATGCTAVNASQSGFSGSASTLAVGEWRADRTNSPALDAYGYQIENWLRTQALAPPYRSIVGGPVWIRMHVMGDGRVREVYILHDRSVQDADLHRSALALVRAAEPFPRLPRELPYQELWAEVRVPLGGR